MEKVGKLCLNRNGDAPKPRKYTVIEGFGLDHNLGVYNNGVDAIGRALTERYFFCADKQNGGFRNVIKPVPNAYNKHEFKDFRNKVMLYMPDLPCLSRRQVVDRYTGSKRRVYEDALLSLQRKSINERDARLNMFVKFEKQDLGKAPRGINPRDPRYNLELGRYLKHAEKPFFKAINKAYGKHTPHTVIKGLNADASAAVLRMKWDRFNDPVAVGLDAEKFDAHVSVDALRFEHSFYRELFPGSRRLHQLLLWQLRNKGVAYAKDGKVKFEIRGTRSSGDLNTSLGNCLIMCGCVYSYAAHRHVDVELANNGDDCVIFMERKDLSRFLDGIDGWFKDRGFAMVAEEPVYEFDQIEFCQTRPIRCQTGWRMVRNHDAVLKKDPICLIAVQNDKVFRKWLQAVGECGTHATSCIPVQYSFYSALLRHGIECTDAMREHIFKGGSMMTRLHGLVESTHTITPEARVSYYYAFGILPDHQIEIERYYDSAVISEWLDDNVKRRHLCLEPGIKILTI